MKNIFRNVILVLGLSMLITFKVDAQSAMDFIEMGQNKEMKGDYLGAIEDFNRVLENDEYYAEANLSRLVVLAYICNFSNGVSKRKKYPESVINSLCKEIDSLKLFNPGLINKLQNGVDILERLDHSLTVLDSLLKIKDSYNKIGLVLTGMEYSFSDIGSQFGLSFTFYNGFSKVIKYIETTVRPYNRVGDIQPDDFLKDQSRVKIIGPIESNTESNVSFDDLFWDDSDLIQCLKVTYIKVTFMDNSVKEIFDINNHLGEGVKNDCK